MDLNNFNYELPKELIAQYAIEPRDNCRMFVVKNENDNIKYFHKNFFDIIDFLEKDDVLVINETKVSRAKIIGKKTSGGVVEIMLSKKLDDYTFESRIKHKVNVGTICLFENNLECKVIDKKDDIFIIKFNKIIDEKEEKNFILPLPPYIKEKIKDENSYQTVYSKKEGSLAAPTAGLHFTPELLKKIEEKGIIIAKICLHVGFGTFLPIRTNIIEEHKMHSEKYEIIESEANKINNRKGRLFVVGTTSVRTLESSSKEGKIIPGYGETDIFIYPGYNFKNKIDGLITNFHLPKSTLLLLLSAYFGREKVLESYKIAVQEKYRFFSLGDSTLFLK